MEVSLFNRHQARVLTRLQYIILAYSVLCHNLPFGTKKVLDNGRLNALL